MMSEPLLLEMLPLMCNVSVVVYLFEKASHSLLREIYVAQLILFKYLFCTAETIGPFVSVLDLWRCGFNLWLTSPGVEIFIRP